MAKIFPILFLSLFINCSSNLLHGQEATIPYLDLNITIDSHWVESKENVTNDPAKGGIIFRIVHAMNNAIIGAPKLEVIFDPLQVKEYSIDEVIEKQKSLIKANQETYKINEKTLKVDDFILNGINVKRITHQYALGKNTTELDVTHMYYIWIHQKRGVSIQISGRTELFKGTESQINSMLNSISSNQ